MRAVPRWSLPAIACVVAACSSGEERGVVQQPKVVVAADQADAETLGREVLELVDRAVDYRGSHRGRPAGSLRQLGIDSLTPSTARHLVNVNREPVVTVSFRKIEDSCGRYPRAGGRTTSPASMRDRTSPKAVGTP